MTIYETLAAVDRALQGAARLASLCEHPDGIKQEDFQRLAVKVAAQLKEDIACARAGLNGSAPINPG